VQRLSIGGVGEHLVIATYGFTNVSERTCLLSGRPAITAVVNGAREHLRVAEAGDFASGVVPADVPPGRQAVLALSASQLYGIPCSRLRDLTDPAFTLSGGRGTVSSTQAIVTTHCPLFEGYFGRVEAFRMRGPTASSAEELLAGRLSVPPAVPGTTLRYIVTLRNPTARAVRLRPCPGYTETFVSFSRPMVRVVRVYELNCSRIHEIGPHSVVPFAIRIPVPSWTRPGRANVIWQMDGPSPAYSWKSTRITRS
jgi:hypothetical protein